MSALRGVYASATGKVLLTGGYVVLERKSPGLVLSVDARFHATVASITDIPSAPRVQGKITHVPVIVFTPQRVDKPMIVDLVVNPKTRSVQIQVLECEERNKFVELTLLHTLGFLLHTCSDPEQFIDQLLLGMTIHLQGDNTFYSADPTVSVSENKTRKTGLGSSAALVSSLTAALFAFLGRLPVSKDRDPQAHPSDSKAVHQAHVVAQFAHCLAQGKVGSGFDVSACFFGSQRYNRFQKANLSPLLELAADGATATLAQKLTLADAQETKQRSRWDYLVKPFKLPAGMQLVLGDVQGGSETPSMVKKVLLWVSNNPSDPLWANITQANARVEQLLRDLEALSVSDPLYKSTLAAVSDHGLAVNPGPAVSQAVLQGLNSVRTDFTQIRKLMTRLGINAGVPIEPPEQTTLLDATCALPGVLFAAVPGAGGYDAIFAVVLSERTKLAVSSAWAKRTPKVTAMDVEEDKVVGVFVEAVDFSQPVPVSNEDARMILMTSDSAVKFLRFPRSIM